METTVSKGRLGEALACEFLTGKGYAILERNYYTSRGEIDVVFLDNEMLVFGEIKSRYSTMSGIPEEEFDHEKYRKFHQAVIEYIMRHNAGGDSYRIDLLALVLDESSRTCTVRHHKAFY